MKPSNFPERKNQRRKTALARLHASGNPSEINRVSGVLESRIVDDARNVRTKKRRG